MEAHYQDIIIHMLVLLGVRIVDILMEKKCMNPIIFIDELDKVSKTEHGKEIIGILNTFN